MQLSGVSAKQSVAERSRDSYAEWLQKPQISVLGKLEELNSKETAIIKQVAIFETQLAEAQGQEETRKKLDLYSQFRQIESEKLSLQDHQLEEEEESRKDRLEEAEEAKKNLDKRLSILNAKLQEMKKNVLQQEENCKKQFMEIEILQQQIEEMNSLNVKFSISERKPNTAVKKNLKNPNKGYCNIEIDKEAEKSSNDKNCENAENYSHMSNEKTPNCLNKNDESPENWFDDGSAMECETIENNRCEENELNSKNYVCPSELPADAVDSLKENSSEKETNDIANSEACKEDVLTTNCVDKDDIDEVDQFEERKCEDFSEIASGKKNLKRALKIWDDLLRNHKTTTANNVQHVEHQQQKIEGVDIYNENDQISDSVVDVTERETKIPRKFPRKTKFSKMPKTDRRSGNLKSKVKQKSLKRAVKKWDGFLRSHKTTTLKNVIISTNLSNVLHAECQQQEIEIVDISNENENDQLFLSVIEDVTEKEERKRPCKFSRKTKIFKVSKNERRSDHFKTKGTPSKVIIPDSHVDPSSFSMKSSEIEEVDLGNNRVNQLFNFSDTEGVTSELIVDQNVGIENEDPHSKNILVPNDAPTMIEQEDIFEREVVVGNDVIIHDPIYIHSHAEQIDDTGFKDKNFDNSQYAIGDVATVTFHCRICDDVLKSRTSLEKHVKTNHKLHISNLINRVSDGKNVTNKCYNCQCCSYSSERSNEFDKHMKNHILSGEIHPFGKKHRKPETFSQHHRYNAEKYKCSLCSYSCRALKALKKHQKIHTAGTEHYPVKLNCKICGENRASKQEMQEHMKTHRNKKHYLCDLCNFSNLHLHIVRRHRLIHTSEKPYVCPDCSYRSARKDHVHRHIRRKH